MSLRDTLAAAPLKIIIRCVIINSYDYILTKNKPDR